MAFWLSLIPECGINSSTQKVPAQLPSIQLEEDECLVSFDVVSLYTNVPVKESIQVCADLLFNQITMSIDKETFVTLAELACCDVVISTHRGYYRQTDGLAMGSPAAPALANGWLSQFEDTIKADSKLYERYMDDILCTAKTEKVEERLRLLNDLHPNLDFTLEIEVNGKLSFLDMTIYNEKGSLSSGWFRKATDTGLTLNFHSLAPNKYKKSVVISFIYRIYRACSNWKNFHIGLTEAKETLHRNQYPDNFLDPIIHETINKIVNSDDAKDTTCDNISLSSLDSNACLDIVSEKDKFRFYLSYRGKLSDQLANSFRKLNAPCKVIMTTRKIKTCLPSLKPPVPRMLLSNVVYQLTCPGCSASYVGMTTRHIQQRCREHLRNGGTMKAHFGTCTTNSSEISEEKITKILDRSNSLSKLYALEALYISEIKPSLNTKDEYRSRALTLKIY